MSPTKKQGPLEKQLNSYLALSNQKKIQDAGMLLKSAARQRIEACGELSGDEVKTLSNAMNKFVERRNETLARRVMRAIDNNSWDTLKIELLSFSYAKNGHMERMGIAFLPLTPYHLVLQAVDRLDRMYQLDVTIPSSTLLESFITIDYPKIDPEEPSETMAKRKISGYFRLLDSANPNNCWRLVAELSLFELSSTSLPSEVKTTATGAIEVSNSTFLTGRADFVIVTLTGDGEAVVQNLKVKKELAQSFYHPLTYETLALRLKSAGLGAKVVVESLQFLVIEAKLNTELRKRGGSKTHRVEDEAVGSENSEEGSPPETDDNTDEWTDRESEAGAEGRGSEESYEDAERKRGNKRKGAAECEDSEDGGEDDTLSALRNGSGDDDEENEGDVGEHPTGLKKSLPQVVSECVAMRSGPFRDKIIKFILSDGDNWIFGLVDCTKGKGGRVCYQTVVSVSPGDSGNNRAGIRGCVLTVLKLLAFWAIIPGAQLKRLFLKK